MLHGYHPSDEVTEFNESPWCGSHFKLKKHLRVFKDDDEYCVGDFVTCTHHPNKVFRIDQINTSPNTARQLKKGDVIPTTRIICSEFMWYDKFLEVYNHQPSQNNKAMDLVKAPGSVVLPVHRIIAKHEVVLKNHPHQARKSVCRWSYDTHTRTFSEYEPRVVRFTFPQVIEGEQVFEFALVLCVFLFYCLSMRKTVFLTLPFF
jgi:hypothetical protein